VRTARELAVAPDPLSMARSLVERGRACVSLLHAADVASPFGRFSFVAADPDRASTRLDPTPDDDGPRLGGALGSLPRWIGALPYEARRGLERGSWAPPDRRAPARFAAPRWYRYPAVVAVDHWTGRVMVAGIDETAVGRLARMVAEGSQGAPVRTRLQVVDVEPPTAHEERVARALDLIVAGDLYQVNLARKLRLQLHEGDALSLYAALSRAAPTPFGACLHLGDEAVVSTSPELFLQATARSPSSAGGFDRLLTLPIKGTRPRGADAVSDARLLRELDEDPKERAELTMIVDVERHDLGRVAEPGSVRLVGPPRLETFRTLHHRHARLVARARADASREDVMASMLPSGSVTGAPKVRAMEVIATLESERRGLYTGALGHITHEGGVTLSMAIRTAVLTRREGEYWVGGGIVADSNPRRELEETRWKALQLERIAARMSM
jgi:anthranilate/para-aminobenzoate synthase component I